MATKRKTEKENHIVSVADRKLQLRALEVLRRVKRSEEEKAKTESIHVNDKNNTIILVTPEKLKKEGATAIIRKVLNWEKDHPEIKRGNGALKAKTYTWDIEGRN